MGPSPPLRQQSWSSSVFLLGKCLWGGTGRCGGGAGPSFAQCPGQTRFAAALLWLDPKQRSFASYCCAGKSESFPDTAEWEHHLLKVQHCQEAWCRAVLACLKVTCSHMSPRRTGTTSQMLLQSGRMPLQHCLFPFVPSPRRLLGEELQVALMEGMLGAAERGPVLPDTSPQKAAATWKWGKRQRAREHWLLLFSNSF